MSTTALTDADVAYVRAGFSTLEELCNDRFETAEQVREAIAHGLLPQPSYVLADGTAMFPPDYFDLVDAAGGAEQLREHFAARHRAARETELRATDPLDADWSAYMRGIYGVCLCSLTPEAIVRKGALVSSICELLVLARPADPGWRRALRSQVDELDSLERDFAPDYDRAGRFGRAPTRDILIKVARERHADVFSAESNLHPEVE